MITPILFHAQFIAGQVGATGLTVTVDLDSIVRSTGVRTVLVTAGVAREGRDGNYYYTYATADLATTDYVCIFKTTSTAVELQAIPSLRTDNTTAALLFYAFFTAGLTGLAGLTPTVDLDSILRTNGARTALVTSGNAIEGRDGYYYYQYAGSDLTTRDYVATFQTTNTTVDYRSIPSVWTEFAFTAVSLVVNPVIDAALTISVMAGDDYYAIDGRSLDFSSTSWPDLTGASITFSSVNISISPNTSLSVTGIVLTSSSCRIELSALNTIALGLGMGNYKIVATLSDTHIITLVTGKIIARNY